MWSSSLWKSQRQEATQTTKPPALKLKINTSAESQKEINILLVSVTVLGDPNLENQHII